MEFVVLSYTAARFGFGTTGVVLVSEGLRMGGGKVEEGERGGGGAECGGGRGHVG